MRLTLLVPLLLLAGCTRTIEVSDGERTCIARDDYSLNAEQIQTVAQTIPPIFMMNQDGTVSQVNVQPPKPQAAPAGAPPPPEPNSDDSSKTESPRMMVQLDDDGCYAHVK